MLLRLLLLFTIVPVVEVALLIKIGQAIDWGPTVALVIVTGVAGAALARREGLRTLGKIQSELTAGRSPSDAMIDALLIVVAGVVLVTPGVLTDGIGLALLIPPIRGAVRNRIKRYFQARFQVVHFPGMPPADPDDDLIDVEAREHEDR